MNNRHIHYLLRRTILLLTGFVLSNVINIADVYAEDGDSTRVIQPFKSNTFYKIGGGVNMHYSSYSGINYNYGHDIIMAVGKQFGRFSSIRISGTVESYFIRQRRAWVGEADILYGVGTHNFIEGKRSNRILEFTPFIGGGFVLHRSKSTWSPNANAQIGAEIGLRLTQNLYFTLEPVWKYYFHELEIKGDNLTETSAGITAGLKYEAHNLHQQSTYNKDRHLLAEDDPIFSHFLLDNTFYRLGAGVNIQKSTRHNSYNPGMSYDISMGKRLTKLSSTMLKFAFDKGSNKQKSYNVDLLELDVVYGFDLSSALYGYKFNRIFNVSALAGAGVDVVAFDGGDYVFNSNVQAGADFNLRLNDSFALFVNPMAKIFLLGNKEKYQEDCFSLELTGTFGVQYNIHRNGYRKPDGHYIYDSYDQMHKLVLSDRRLDRKTNSLTDYSFITFLGGANFISAEDMNYNQGYKAGFEIGRYLNRYNTIALDINYENAFSKTASKTVEFYGIDLIHSIELTNLNNVKGGFHPVTLKTVGGLGFYQSYIFSRSYLAGTATLGMEVDFNPSSRVSLIIRPALKGAFGKLTYHTSGNLIVGSVQLDAGVRLNMENRIQNRLGKDRYSEKVIPTSKYGFNALPYALQKRHRPDDELFARKRHFDNSFLQIGYGLENVAYNAGTYSMLKNMNISYGKRVMMFSSFLASLTCGSLHNMISDANVRFNEFEILHSFHLTSLLHGYSQKHLFELSTLEGIGIDAIHESDAWRMNGNVMIGLDMQLRLSHTISFIVNPHFKVYTDGIDGDLAENWRSYDFGYGVSAGIRFNLTAGENK